MMKKDDDGTTNYLPQILIGASSSSRIGWLMKISLAFVHKYLISYSASWTGFPGRLPRTMAKGQQADRQSTTLWVKDKDSSKKIFFFWDNDIDGFNDSICRPCERNCVAIASKELHEMRSLLHHQMQYHE